VLFLPVKQHLLDGGVCRVGIQRNGQDKAFLYCELCILKQKIVEKRYGLESGQVTGSEVWLRVIGRRRNYIVMERKGEFFGGIATAVLWLAGVGLAQNATPTPSPLPPSSSDGLGAQLIVWSETQQPRPLESFSSETDRRENNLQSRHVMLRMPDSSFAAGSQEMAFERTDLSEPGLSEPDSSNRERWSH
jgi:hypothetical protein